MHRRQPVIDVARGTGGNSRDQNAQGGVDMTMVGKGADRIWSRLLFTWCWLAAAARDLGRWSVWRLQTPGWQQQRAPAHGLVEIAILIGVVAVATLGFAKLVMPAITSAGERAITSLNGSGTGATGAGT